MSHTDPHTPSSSASRSESLHRVSGGPRLRREAIVVPTDRGRLGMLVALCSLAGVVVGFGLSNMASSMRVYRCPSTLAAPVTPPAWLGVRITTAAEGGARVDRVDANSPAQAIGIERGDVIVGVSYHCPRRVLPVKTSTDLVRLVRNADVGDYVWIKLHRGDQEHQMRVQLAQIPNELFLLDLR